MQITAGGDQRRYSHPAGVDERFAAARRNFGGRLAGASRHLSQTGSQTGTLKNIEGREANVHWVITRPMLDTAGRTLAKAKEYVAFWSARAEVDRI